jgi:SAM-dependent methyltransferase
MALSNDQVREALNRYSWYHCIDVAPGLQTPGIRSFLPIQRPVSDELRRFSLTGKRVLDIGCRDGQFSFEAERMGAAEVLGIDNDLSPGAVEFLIPHFDSRVRMRAINLYDFTVPPAEQFDFVIFAGVLYHLRLPFLGLKRIAEAMRPSATLLIESAIWATRLPVAALHCPAPADSPYEPTSVSFFNPPGLSAALGSMGFVDIECRHVLSNDGSSHAGWSEFLASPYWRSGDKSASKEIDGDSQVHIARAVYTARKASAEDATLSKYWYGEHTLNSSHADNAGFVQQFRQAARERNS